MFTLKNYFKKVSVYMCRTKIILNEISQGIIFFKLLYIIVFLVSVKVTGKNANSL